MDRTVGKPGLVCSGSFEQLGVQAAGVGVTFVFVFAVSYVTFGIIRAVFGLPVSPQEELEGLDIASTACTATPEQFVAPGSEPELEGLLTER